MKIMAVLAVLLATALCVGAVSAADARVVAADGYAFVGENITISGTTQGDDLYPFDATTHKVIAGDPILNGTAQNYILTYSGNFTASAAPLSVGDGVLDSAKNITVAQLAFEDVPSVVAVGKDVTVKLNATVNGQKPAATTGLFATVIATLGTTTPVEKEVTVDTSTNAVLVELGSFESAGTITIALKGVGTSSGATPYLATCDAASVTTVNAVSVAPAPIASAPNAFVYQVIDTGDGATTLTMYKDEIGKSQVVNVISGENGIFNLLDSVVKGNYGAYSTTGGDDTVINIWYPELSLKAELTTGENGETEGDSIDGKTVGKNTKVSFLIEAPKLGTSYATTLATAKIVFTTPAGGKTTQFGDADYKDVKINAVKVLANFSAAGSTAAAGTYTAQAEFSAPDYFKNYADKSNTISFTLQSDTLTVTAAKDSVVRSNPFTVTIGGKANAKYAIYLDGISGSDINPYLQPSQSGQQDVTGISSDVKGKMGDSALIQNGKYTYGLFETDASGKRTVQYNTAGDTEDKTYTVKVYNNADVTDYDSVKIKVEKGAVTVTASGDGSYYIGEEIKLTGTNTDSSNIFLFITGPNLAVDGIQLKEVANKEATASRALYNANPIAVKTDNTWEYKWDTSKCGLDTGAYTIYATSILTNGKASSDAETSVTEYGKKVVVGDTTTYYAVKLSDSEYATVSVNLKQPFLSAVPSGTIVAKGDKIYIRGTAEGDPSTLMLYIFGPNKYQRESITVEDDGTYEKKLDIGSEWASNQYFVVIEHPMYNNEIDVKQVYYDNQNEVVPDKLGSVYTTLEIKNFGNTTAGTAGLQASFVVEGTNKLQGSNAADALTKMIDSANIDDIYTKLTFTVAEPWIKIVNPGDQALGSKFTITGTTNLAVDDQILVEVVSSSFNAVDKTSTSTTSGVSQTTKVVAGNGGDNTWTVEVDTTNWKLDEYTIKASGIEVDVTTTTNFNLVEKVVTPTPTATATGATPTTTTAPATTTPTQTPGFGAFIALAGLGAVALLVLRRN
ncbi:MEMAR_RS02690 family S-layer glycoprotein [Methanocorpusculum vombati]|uniref:PGF-CTERM sorting domain-containing protein n=1 Tax=Methanocorpusculum vombati TaxID=3002864 RepID=A0ABT4IPA9_9EURY|nr:MEMAR_RS02690 family S-layer glycoprotein [Methanocorpusculum vombati]MCZ0863112.1 PGF-CTERM sorting domain-containing protein [Methanocorpusculum vombati]MCZ9319317.1 MEMAR_RS02690 family S-layer glycoprotein [Methanocorpusculum sp.]MDE2534758.1 MEMAR_RS02690 family S-layer glycoprotein [Methanocorpusculum sp.]MDE2547928.1 MEMAR_RS02690 family S-layer glycoprotein [Methanocorpusculum sp.]